MEYPSTQNQGIIAYRLRLRPWFNDAYPPANQAPFDPPSRTPTPASRQPSTCPHRPLRHQSPTGSSVQRHATVRSGRTKTAPFSATDLALVKPAEERILVILAPADTAHRELHARRLGGRYPPPFASDAGQEREPAVPDEVSG